MLLALCILAFASPELKKDGVYEGSTRIVNIEAKKVPYAGQNVVLTGADRVVWVNMMVTPVGDGTAMATVEFPTLARSLGYRILTGKYEDLVTDWVSAGVFAAEGPQLTSLTAWASAATVYVNDTNAAAASLATYAAANPAPAYAPPAAPSPAVSTRAPEPAYQPPVSVRVELYIECKEKVRLSRGGRAGSATYGWEYSNNRTSYSLAPGDEVCICDESDHKQSCMTVGDRDVSVDVGCGGFRTQ